MAGMGQAQSKRAVKWRRNFGSSVIFIPRRLFLLSAIGSTDSRTWSMWLCV